MLQILIRNSALGLAAWCMMIPLAHASDPAPLPSDTLDLALGSWHFETDIYRDGFCTMEGTLHVYPGSTPKTRDCELTAIEVCGKETSIVEQTCQLNGDGEMIGIQSEVSNILEEKSWSVGYSADNFEITSVNDQIMRGELVSTVRANTVFRRMQGGLS